MTMSIALFISPKGDILPVPQNHIGSVIHDPHRFGLTIEEIQTTYDIHGEHLGVEGEARREILLRIIADGWIRLRSYIRPQERWSVTVNELDDRTRTVLKEWAGATLAGTMGFREDDPHKTVVIEQLATGSTSCLTILEVSSSKFVA
ncbi:hypothetical protein ACFL2Q_10705 [Thermodesulfobacteriota bacterium]